jgi:hypothetical protein
MISEHAVGRYSPAECIGARKQRIEGNPDYKHVSYEERNNLNVLHFMYYNFVRIHKTLRRTPAMAARVTDRLWEIIVGVLQAWEASPHSN